MTITKVFIYTAIAAIVLTFFTSASNKGKKTNLFVSYLQNFSGAFFIFSGLVKAVDPLGTAYKMVDYFTEFKDTFEATWLSFITPIFPLLSEYTNGFSVFMIVLEIVLGIMLILGAYNKLSSWLFLLIVGFFTFLTGFTALTGYVPEGVNFFDFANWGEFNKNNMKVTDCGCFGDFLKLEPFTSFKKDIFLLIPAFVFLFKNKDMHTVFTPKIRNGILIGSIVVFTFYCLSNYVWDIPGQDFRPFRVDVNIPERKAAEEQAMANAPVTYEFTNKETGDKTTLSMAQYMKQFQDFPQEKFDRKDIQAEPEVAQTKISEFAVEDFNGEVTDEILNHQGYSLMYVCYTLGYTEGEKTVMVADTSWLVDTVGTPGTEQFQLVKKVDQITQRNVPVTDYQFAEDYKNRFEGIVNPFAEAAQKAGVKVYAIAGKAGEEVIKDFQEEIKASYPIYMADDILLKTIVRSNPGIVLLKDGTILKKWHYKRLPNWDEVEADFVQ
ncbi:MAG: hypothetical protein AAF573_21730 [Bacteroidota bacterium]